ncbi:hypothetical protein IWX47DRAFT_883077 [Phyllosticta citricarpa]
MDRWLDVIRSALFVTLKKFLVHGSVFCAMVSSAWTPEGQEACESLPHPRTPQVWTMARQAQSCKKMTTPCAWL